MSRGFTALELLIGLAVVLLLFALATVPFSSFREAQVLNAAASELTALLAEARSAAVASRDSSEYGVHFEESRTVYFKGTSFVEPSAFNKEMALDRAIEISSIALQGGGNDVVFEMLTGETNDYGAVTLRSKGNTARTKTITVARTGVASHD
ncbi:MAG: prepilin-type N-terminal cleavage/methylation domain-containing protein [bacterium]|nr:prepilin-type N-terminal cleavage/methylation domain-containing protein [bacterium]